MTAPELADYLINNDYELQIVRREIDLIAVMLGAEGIECTPDILNEAVELANDDPLIRQFYRRFA